MAKDTELLNEQEDTEHAENRVYELGFHLDAELPQEEVKKAYQAIRDHIAGAGTIIAEGEPTKIPLAYTISRQETTGRRDFSTAFFCWIAYETDGTGHQGIADFVRGQNSIIRFLDIRTSKDAAKHSAEMHELFARQAEEQARDDEGEEDSASEAELDAALKEAGV